MSGPVRRLHGIGASEGVAIGKAVILGRKTLPVGKYHLAPEQVDRELQRFRASVNDTVERLTRLYKRVRELGAPTNTGILDAYIMLLRDPWLTERTEEVIVGEQVNAEWALQRILKSFRSVFDRLEDPYLRDRIRDIDFVAERLYRHLLGMDLDHFAEIHTDHVVFAQSLGPAESHGLLRRGVLGLVVEGGTRTCHTAVQARANGVPTIVGVMGACQEVGNGDLVIVDGAEGLVILNPDGELLRDYSDRQRRLYLLQRDLQTRRALPAATLDGHALTIRGAINLPEDARAVERMGGQGVGLFRTEYLFLNRERFPDEDEQYEYYRTALEAFPSTGVTIRTVDLGGDKFTSMRHGRALDRGIEGLRAIRLCLARPDFFRAQLRAILRASAHGHTRVLFPFVTTLEEARAARAFLEGVRSELRRERVRVRDDLQVGFMIETPAAALLVDRLAPLADFLAIGSNDLIQYTLAVERGNEASSYLYQPTHPAVLLLIERVAREAMARGLPLSVCGEMASHPLCLPLFVGLGIPEVTCPARYIPLLKETLRLVKREECTELARLVLTKGSHAEVEQALLDFMTPRFPGLESLVVLRQASAPPEADSRRG